MEFAAILGVIVISTCVIVKYFFIEQDEIEKEHKEAKDFRNEGDKNRQR